jgi:hypothetical protein
MKFFEYAINEITSKAGYSSLFKAFVVIATLYLLSLMKVTSLALPIEADSHKLKYAVEYELKKEISFNDLKCNFEMKSYQDCKLAMYKNDLTTKSLEALVSFQGLLEILAYLTGMLSIVGFIFNPYIHKKKT